MRVRFCLLLATFACALTAVPASAATSTSGSVTIAVGGSAATSLKARGVTTSALAPAKLSSRTRRLTLPVTGGTVSARAQTIALGGRLRLTSGRRTVTLTRPRLVLGGSAPSISALIGSARTTIFTISGRKPTVSQASGHVALKGAKLTLAARAAATIASKLRLARRPAGRFGTVTVTARIAPPPPSTATPGQPSTGTTAPGGAQPQPSCRTEVTAVEPTLLDPAAFPGNSPTTATYVEWHVRESFSSYVGSDGGSFTPSAGATSTGSFTFRFPVTGGWTLGSVSQVLTSGSVRLYFPNRFDYVIKNPVLEINGGASRLIFTFSEAGKSDYRRVMTTFASPVAPFTQMPGLVPGGADGAGLMDTYCPGEPWGWTTVAGL